ncbi:mitochondrial outer membrane translocase complex, subunit Tom22 [Xylariaceae sp. FL0804]|nr:mitochondrial outer membrane translocase complex, subunit Tom22 [Xylariaceae sp. FL0804]
MPVELQEILDEHFQAAQPGPADDDGDFTDTDSEISDDSDYDPTSESLAERLYALRDMVPPQTRGYVAGKLGTASSAVGSVLSLGGRALWVLGSSALLVGVPWALAWAEEQQVVEMEKEMKMREMGGELLTAGNAGGAESATAQQVGAALGQEARPAL